MEKSDELRVALARANIDRVIADCRAFVLEHPVEELMKLIKTWSQESKDKSLPDEESLKSQFAGALMCELCMREDVLFRLYTEEEVEEEDGES